LLVLDLPRLSINICLNLAGIGLGLLLWALTELEAHMPTIVLSALVVLAVALIVVPWLIVVAQRIGTKDSLDLDELGPAIFGAHQEEIARRARQIAKDNVDREEGRFKGR
jgi:hypothetical protein